MSTILVLDFEGTGLLKETDDPHGQPGIVEVGALRADFPYTARDEFNELVNPETVFEEEAQKITGISPAEVDQARPFSVVGAHFAQFCLGSTHLITFNGTGYDIPLLQFNLRRYGLETRFPWPPIQIDVMRAASDYLNLAGKTGNKSPKLIELYTALFGHGFTGAHRGLTDATATLECALRLWSEGVINL